MKGTSGLGVALATMHLVTLSPCHLVTLSPCRANDVIDSPMYRSPELQTARLVMVFPNGLTERWVEALGRPEADGQTWAALTIALAHERGMKGLDKTVPALLQALERTGDQRAVRLAVCRALVTLDGRAAADALFRQAQA